MLDTGICPTILLFTVCLATQMLKRILFMIVSPATIYLPGSGRGLSLSDDCSGMLLHGNSILERMEQVNLQGQQEYDQLQSANLKHCGACSLIANGQ